ncbi:hypothetical protein [Mycobacterium attenuatum]|nr:hypothetical protein [Mycobacterium attenuatum]
MTVPTPSRAPVGTDCDLLGDVPTPAGVTAEPWRADDGRLVRTLSDGRVQRGTGTIVGECGHCTVPVDDGDVCAFCATYTPPATVAQQVDVLVNRIDLVRHDGNEILRQLPAQAPLFAVLDVVTALGHLRQAAIALDKAAAALEADAEAVTR